LSAPDDEADRFTLTREGARMLMVLSGPVTGGHLAVLESCGRETLGNRAWRKEHAAAQARLTEVVA
jgi:hypothetical protein